jgi:hypothetical protein
MPEDRPDPVGAATPSAFGPQWVGPTGVAGPGVLIAVSAVGAVAAISLTWDRPGVGWLIAGVMAATAIFTLAWRGGGRPRADRLAWAATTVALLAVGAVRAAPWLFVLCIPAAGVCGALTVAGGRTRRGLFLGTVSVPIAALRGLPWASRGLRMVRTRSGGAAGRTLAAVAVSVVLLLVFGALLAGADTAFASLVDVAMPTVDGATLLRWLATFALVVFLMVGVCFVAAAPPSFDGESGPRRTWRRVDWALPVGTVVSLFAVFVAVQATVLFGGGGHVLRTSGLTYAEYARTGFWQLSTVTVLTLLVIAMAARGASRVSAADRAWLRLLLGGLAVLSLVIVASALTRMWTYEQAYGFTRLRVLVSVCEMWLGVVFVLVLLAGIRLRAPWLPRAIVGTAVAALLGVAAVNPDGFIAERNVVRYDTTHRIDVDYLSQLSADAVPALERLPEPLRGCVLAGIRASVDRPGPDEWREWNLGRERARQATYRAACA